MLIQQRSSWRSCTGAAIPLETLHELETFVANQTRGLFGKHLRFQVAAARSNDSQELRGLGTYGFIRGASAFIIGAIDRNTDNLEDYGYLMEQIVLYATQLNLATCWLGGSFQKDNFSARINTQPHEIVPAVVSVGIGAAKRNMTDRLIRNVAGSKKRRPWDQLFFEAGTISPLRPESNGKLSPVFEMVRLSPSASNKQPWRLILEGNDVHFFLQRNKGYRKSMFSDLQRIDMGIAISHFDTVCRELNINGTWNQDQNVVPPKEDWEYTITWTCN